MISPIGSFMVRFDTAILAAMDAGITGLTAYAGPPVVTSLAIYYMLAGVKVAQGDGGPVQYFVTQLVKNILILWFSSRADIYNQWVRDFFYVNLPNALNKAVLAKTLAGITPIANGVTGTAAAFDQVWALMDQMVDRVLTTAPLLDFSSRLSATFASLAGGGALLVIAMVYLMSRIILAVVLVLGVIAIFCLIFDVTKGVFERWLGKVISLVFLQVTAIVVLQLVVSIERDFMTQIAASHSGLASDVQALSAMITMFFMGAFAIYSLPAIAYSIGTGVSVSAMPLMYMAARAAQAAISAVPGLGLGVAAAAPAAAVESTAGLSMGLAQEGLGTGGGLAIPAPSSLPPPPLSLPGY